MGVVTSSGIDNPGGPELQTPRPQLLAALTDGHFLHELEQHGAPLSRAEIAERSGLSKPAISSAAARLLDHGVIREAGVRDGRRGGVATLLELDPDHGHSLAIAIEADAVTVRSRDFTGRVLTETTRALPGDARPGEVVDAANALLRAARSTGPLLAATVSMADPVDSSTGVPVPIGDSGFLGGHFDPRAELDLAPRMPVVVDNDVNWAAIAEQRSGALRGFADFVYVHCGRGFGAGLVLGGSLYRGHHGLAGEISYIRESGDSSINFAGRLHGLGVTSNDELRIDVDAFRRVFDGQGTDATTRRIIDIVAAPIATLLITLDPRGLALGGPLTTSAGFVSGLKSRILDLTLNAPEIVLSDSTPLEGASGEAHRLAFSTAIATAHA